MTDQDMFELAMEYGACGAAQIRVAVERLEKMTEDQRMKAFSYFCACCGSADPNCQCWNDE